MSVCSNCGAEVTGAFCTQCGTRAVVPTESESNEANDAPESSLVRGDAGTTSVDHSTPPPGDGPDGSGVPRALIITLAGVVAVLVVILVIVLLTGDHDSSVSTDLAPSTSYVPEDSVVTSTAPPTTDVAPSVPTTATPSPVLAEPAGLLCRDLNAKGYSYEEAMIYWEHHGKPENMDASGMGIPCQSVYDRSDVIAYWGELAKTQPVNLDHQLLWGYEQNERNVRGASWLMEDLADDIAWLNSNTTADWDETRLIALGASRCNDLWVVGEVEEWEKERDEKKWARAIAPVLGISVADAQTAIDAGLGYKYSTLCE